MGAISSKAEAFGKPISNLKFNDGSELNQREFDDGSGLELYSTFYRMYDLQIGRWFVQDPKYDHSQSLYNSMANNPILNNDPKGDTLVSEKDKLIHELLKYRITSARNYLNTELANKRSELEANGDKMTKEQKKDINKNISVLKQRISALNRTLYDMKLIETDQKHGYSYNMVTTPADGITAVDPNSGVINMTTSITLAPHEIKHAADFAKGRLNVVFEEGRFGTISTSSYNALNTEINSYRAQFGLNGSATLPDSDKYRTPKNIYEITRQWLNSLKDSNGNILYHF